MHKRTLIKSQFSFNSSTERPLKLTKQGRLIKRERCLFNFKIKQNKLINNTSQIKTTIA